MGDVAGGQLHILHVVCAQVHSHSACHNCDRLFGRCTHGEICRSSQAEEDLPSHQHREHAHGADDFQISEFPNGKFVAALYPVGHRAALGDPHYLAHRFVVPHLPKYELCD